MTPDEHRRRARPRAASADAGAPVLRLERDEDVPGLVAWFGEDRSRESVALVLRGEDAGLLLRSDVYELMSTRSMGGFGDSARSGLPGETVAWRTIVLECPEAGCEESPVYAVAFDPRRPPHCRLHPERPLRPR